LALIELLVGIAFVAGAIWLWDALSKSKVGKRVQAAIASVGYLAWFSIIPLTLFIVGKTIAQAIFEGRSGNAAFVAIISLTFLPMFIMVAIPWNFYCRFVWRKTGVKLPQSARLAGKRPYSDWERET
jgi:membrane-anchored glycerophosphoryl diester phosphodiesterase (GDPDase)